MTVVCHRGAFRSAVVAICGKGDGGGAVTVAAMVQGLPGNYRRLASEHGSKKQEAPRAMVCGLSLSTR